MKLGIYKHYKGALYEVIGIGNHTEFLEKFVVYKALEGKKDYPAGTIWVRPLEMFKENVIVEGEEMPRFEFVQEK